MADAERFERTVLPERLCNLDRLLHALRARDLDGIVAIQPLNLFYLTSFNGVAHKADEPRPYAVILSRHAPEQPVLVIADYYLATFLRQPSWVRDIRPFRAVMMPLDLPPAAADIDRFIPAEGRGVAWLERARQAYAFDRLTAVRQALKDLRLDRGRVAFDDLGFGQRLGLDGMSAVDAYDPLMYARAVKTDAELALLERATRLNQAAIERTVSAWRPGFTWRDLGHAYNVAVAGLGGFVHDPGGMVWGHPRGADRALTLQTGLEDDVVGPGTHVLFDCHGSLDLYCWDGGKTWVVDGAPQGPARRAAAATAEAAQALLEAMRPGVRVSALQAAARAVYRKAGMPDAAAAVIFFHGLGLSHMDLEIETADGAPNADWVLEAGMVVPLHLLWPGGATERIWLEEVVAVTPDGGRPLFSWGFAPLTG